MSTLSTTKVIEIRWEIFGFPGYVFGDDKNLYNKRTGRKIKKTINGRSMGYWLGKKFLSINKLKYLLKRPEKIEIPF